MVNMLDEMMKTTSKFKYYDIPLNPLPLNIRYNWVYLQTNIQLFWKIIIFVYYFWNTFIIPLTVNLINVWVLNITIKSIESYSFSLNVSNVNVFNKFIIFNVLYYIQCLLVLVPKHYFLYFILFCWYILFLFQEVFQSSRNVTATNCICLCIISPLSYWNRFLYVLHSCVVKQTKT